MGYYTYMNNQMNIVRAAYQSEISSMFIVELINGLRYWAWGTTARDIAVGYEIGLPTFLAEVSDRFWQARKHTWKEVA
jgi:hypothetical protein